MPNSAGFTLLCLAAEVAAVYLALLAEGGALVYKELEEALMALVRRFYLALQAV